MKNKEKYLDELTEILIANGSLAVNKYTNKPASCINISLNCDNCLFNGNCNDNGQAVREWLEAEYKEPIKLTDDEIVILKNINKMFDWIDRDEDNVLVVCARKLFKGELYCNIAIDHEYLAPFSHLFQFIKKYESYNIDELLKQNGVER